MNSDRIARLQESIRKRKPDIELYERMIREFKVEYESYQKLSPGDRPKGAISESNILLVESWLNRVQMQIEYQENLIRELRAKS